MKAMEFDINGPAFDTFKADLNEKILECMEQLYAGNFSGGEISAKIKIEMENMSEMYPGASAEGEVIGKRYKYVTPIMEHKITLNLKKRSEAKGTYCDAALELTKQDDGKFIMIEVPKAQMSLLD